MDIKVTGGQIKEAELQAYIDHGKEQYPDRVIEGLDIELDGEYVNLHYRFQPEPFERIRRITGYLVGTLDHFNDAKKAEVRDRVKHGLEGGFEKI